jgi:ATP-dependent Clp protease ATP-binding subunit ClpB
MNIDLYSDRAKQAVQSAQSLALARGHQQFAPEHLLKVLLEEKDGLSRALIQSAGGRPDAADAASSPAGQDPARRRGRRPALHEARHGPRLRRGRGRGAKAGDAFVTTERLLIAIAKEGGDAAKILKDAGASPRAWRPPPTPSARAAPPTAPRRGRL